MSSAASRILGRGSIYTLASAAPMLTGLLVTPALTRSLPIAEYGRVSVAIVTMQFVLGLLSLGLPLVITRHAHVEGTGTEGARGLVLTGALAVLLLSVAVSSGYLGVAALLGSQTPWPVLLAVVAGGAGAGMAMAQAYALAKEASWFYVALAFAMSLAAPAAGLFAILLTSATASAYFGAVVGVFLIAEIGALWRIRSAGRSRTSRREFADSLRMGLPLVPHQLAIGSATGAAVLVARWQLGIDGGAHAQIAAWLGTAPLIIVSAIGYAWLPQLLSVPAESRGASLEETSGAIAWLATLGASSVALLSPWLLRLLVSSEYDVASMVPATSLVCLTAVVATVFLAYMQLVIAGGHTQRFALGSPLSLVGGSLVALATIEWLGLAAIGLGYVSTYLLLTLFARHESRRCSEVRWSLTRVLPAGAFGLAGCLSGALLPVDGLVGTPVRAGGAMLCLLGALWLLRRTMTGSREVTTAVAARGDRD